MTGSRFFAILAASFALAVVAGAVSGGVGSPVYLDSVTKETRPEQTRAGFLGTADGGVVNVMDSPSPTGAGEACVTKDGTHCVWGPVTSYAGSGTADPTVAPGVPAVQMALYYQLPHSTDGGVVSALWYKNASCDTCWTQLAAGTGSTQSLALISPNGTLDIGQAGSNTTADVIYGVLAHQALEGSTWGAAYGVCPLNASAQIPAANIPFGTAADQVCSGATCAGLALPTGDVGDVLMLETANVTAAGTGTATQTVTGTQTVSSTATATASQSVTQSGTHTQTDTTTPSITQTGTATSTGTVTQSGTSTQTTTPSASSTSTVTRSTSNTQSGTSTKTQTDTPTYSTSSTSTSTQSQTGTQTITKTQTGTQTVTATATYTAIATGQSTMQSMALHGGYVYWSSDGNSKILRVPIGGGSVTTLDSSQNGPFGIATDNTYVYWVNSNAGTIMRDYLYGGNPSTLASGYTSPVFIAVGASFNVFWTGFSDGVVMQRESTGNLITLASGEGGPTGITQDGVYVYWTTGIGEIKRAPIGGGTVTTITDSQSGPYGIAVDASNVYWTNSNDGTVKQKPLIGGSIITLFGPNGSAEPFGIAIDAAYVYWVDYNLGNVYKVAIGGGSVVTMASSQSEPTAIAVDDTYLYWLAGGSVLKMAKNPTSTVTVTQTGTGTQTDTTSAYSTRSSSSWTTDTASQTNTITPTVSSTSTITQSSTYYPSSTYSSTSTTTGSQSTTSSTWSTRTDTVTATITPTVSSTVTATSSVTGTQTATSTATHTVTSAGTATGTKWQAEAPPWTMSVSTGLQISSGTSTSTGSQGYLVNNLKITVNVGTGSNQLAVGNHTHNYAAVTTSTPTQVLPTPGAVGTATDAARADHRHQFGNNTAKPAQLPFGGTDTQTNSSATTDVTWRRAQEVDVDGLVSDLAGKMPASGGSTNKLARWSSTTALTYSNNTDDGTTLTCSEQFNATGAVTPTSATAGVHLGMDSGAAAGITMSNGSAPGSVNMENGGGQLNISIGGAGAAQVSSTGIAANNISATPTANYIPKADSGAKLNSWVEGLQYSFHYAVLNGSVSASQNDQSFHLVKTVGADTTVSGANWEIAANISARVTTGGGGSSYNCTAQALIVYYNGATELGVVGNSPATTVTPTPGYANLYASLSPVAYYYGATGGEFRLYFRTVGTACAWSVDTSDANGMQGTTLLAKAYK